MIGEYNIIEYWSLIGQLLTILLCDWLLTCPLPLVPGEERGAGDGLLAGAPPHHLHVAVLHTAGVLQKLLVPGEAVMGLF